MQVVGVLSGAIFVTDDSATSFLPKALLSRAFTDEYGGDVATYPGGFTARLRNGADDLPAVTSALRERFADATELELSPSSEVDRRIDSGIDVTVTALLLCAVALGSAGIVAVGQALSRQQAQQAQSRRWLAALGMSRRGRIAATVLASVPIALAGAAVAVAIAVVASPIMPVGIARRAEPEPGLSIDVPVLGIGFVGISLAVVLLAVVGALVTVRRERGPERGGLARPSRAVEALRRSGAPPAATIGAGMVLEPRRGTAGAVRAALAGIAAGAAGVIAVLVFGASLDGLLDVPDRYGAPYDAAVSGYTSGLQGEGGTAVLVEDPDVDQLGLMLSDLGQIDGAELNVYSLESLAGDASFTVVDGRLPQRAGEVALGAETSDDSGVGIGDRVEIRGTSGEVLSTEVVGTAALPIVDERSAVGRGAVLLPEELEAIAGPDLVSHDLLVRWADGVDVDSANRALGERLEAEVFTPRLPGDVKNLDDVRSLPRALAVIVGLIATLAAVHALMSTARLRHRDLAVLATLGFQRRQLVTLVAWQAATLAAVGLLVGVPLGIVLGQRAWGAIAEGIGVVDVAVTPVPEVVAVVGVTVAVGALAALAPSRSLRRLRPASSFRSRA